MGKEINSEPEYKTDETDEESSLVREARISYLRMSENCPGLKLLPEEVFIENYLARQAELVAEVDGVELDETPFLDQAA